ncbi:MAG: imidazole glycerol phosphate synthase, glutamine amidotransferase subunit [Betaproteobacteria bacterium]|nr:imidazole glycerol phosphate synthase, glutamine amidotransferase subunit [Betaproteobacteria bacterium]
MTDIAVIDYGMGNLHSVSTRLMQAAPGLKVTVTSDPAVVAGAARVVFPGQGAMPDCMRELDAHGLRDAVLDAAYNKPFLGICIGLQMLFDHSDEGGVVCLGLLPGKVRRFADSMTMASGERVKVPHMGWNRVRQVSSHALWNDIPDDAHFYFVHSYYIDTTDTALIAGTSDYPAPFSCAIARDNVFAVQFHPEKSGADGLQLLVNFVQWQPLSRLVRPAAAAAAR